MKYGQQDAAAPRSVVVSRFPPPCAMVTDAAESSLRSDDSDEPVHRVLIERRFSAFVEGRFLRNDELWPGQ